MHNEAIARYKELQILYDVSELKASRAQLQMEKQAVEHDWHHKMLIFSVIALVVLIVLIIVLGYMYTKTRRLALNLEKSKIRLQNEKKNLLATQEELIQARDQAEQANRTQTQFIQNMRHEILTPLNAITGFSQLVVDSVPENMRATIDRYAEIINDNSELLRTLVNDVLDISLMESGEIKLSRQGVSLNQLCSRCVTSMARKVKPGVVMSFENSHDNDLMVFTDSARVEQVLNNFLSNAVKYTDSGKITLAYDVDESRNEVIFSVTDTGIGIPEGKEEVIFDRFVKLSRYQTGTGLGLNICRFVAGMLGGSVKVDKSYNKGARFLFILPID
ncbi:MAG: histidine kinase [Bacteroidales bacterium]|nr:MAG: histidine kinase [Bacteroidales bacterium]